MTMISRGVEISIAGGGGEMVHVLSLCRFFFLFSFFCNHALFVSRYKKPYAALAMKTKKTYKCKPTALFTSSWEKSNTPSP